MLKITVKTGNRILDLLPTDVLERLKPALEPVDIVRNQIVHHPGEEIRFLYFPITCMISITVTMSEGLTVEAGAAGSREVVGINAFMGGRETTQTEYVGQIAGKALKIAADPVKVEFDRNTEFRSIMLKYTQALIAQISQNAACNKLHQLGPRCARWLLEVSDRIQSDSFALSHEFIAEMLGISRVSVTLAMETLKKKNIIKYARSNISILDMPALERESCECYSILHEEYDRLLGTHSRN